MARQRRNAEPKQPVILYLPRTLLYELEGAASTARRSISQEVVRRLRAEQDRQGVPHSQAEGVCR